MFRLWFVQISQFSSVVMASLGNTGKHKRSPPSLKEKREKKTVRSIPTVSVHTFGAPFTFEACICESKPGTDGFTNSVQKVMAGEQCCPCLEGAGFCDWVPRRVPGSRDSTILCSHEKKKCTFWRGIVIRHPGDAGSTAESRAEGLELMKKFFTDEEFTQFVPSEIATVDLSEDETPPPLDEFFLDRDIRKFVETEVDESFLNENFHQEHHDLAVKCWREEINFKFANELGFPK